MAQERDDLVYLAKLAEQAERFDEMVERRRCTHMHASTGALQWVHTRLMDEMRK